MKIAKIMILAMIVALAGTTMAQAAGEVQMGRTVAVSADVKNSSDYTQQAAVRMLAYDTVGNVVGHLCREVSLPANEVITVSYLWRAPAYETGLYWSPKVTVNDNCVNHDSDDSDSDSDSDGDRDDSDEYYHY